MKVALVIFKLTMDISCPLLFFELVEMYFPNRVMKQFVFKQYIPSEIDTSDQLYFISRLGKHADCNWIIYHL